MRKPKSRKTPRKIGWRLSDETKRKISEAQIGRKRSEEFRQSASNRMQREWAKGKRPARVWTEEQKRVQSEKIRASWERRKAQ